MPRHNHQDPTEFFSVVGAPYVREQHGFGHHMHDRTSGDRRSRRFGIGVASAFAAFCAVALGVSLFASEGAAKLMEVAYHAVR